MDWLIHLKESVPFLNIDIVRFQLSTTLGVRFAGGSWVSKENAKTIGKAKSDSSPVSRHSILGSISRVGLSAARLAVSPVVPMHRNQPQDCPKGVFSCPDSNYLIGVLALRA